MKIYIIKKYSIYNFIQINSESNISFTIYKVFDSYKKCVSYIINKLDYIDIYKSNIII